MVTPVQFQLLQARTTQAALLLIRRQWRRMESLDDWPKIEPRVSLLTAAGQKVMTENAVGYTAATLGTTPVVATSAFVGVAPDGRPLDSMLYSSVVHARATYADTADQLASGQARLSMLAKTALADAGRGAAQVQITATPNAGYVRQVSPPCCQRCAILAGKRFRWNEGFLRHPGCDCVHVPTVNGVTPDGYTADITLDDIRDLTEAQRTAIEDGADFNQVLNAYRDRIKDRPGYMFTSEGMSRRGFAFQKGARGRRLTPEAIYRTADSREDAVRLLIQHGYVRAM